MPCANAAGVVASSAVTSAAIRNRVPFIGSPPRLFPDSIFTEIISSRDAVISKTVDSRGRKRCIRTHGGLRSPREATCPRIASSFFKGRSMSSYTSISPDKLSRLIGTTHTPVLVDVRLDEDFAVDPRLIPGARRRSHLDVQDWAPSLAGHAVVVICEKGQKLSEGTAAWLRHGNIAAEILEGGHVAWKEAELPTVPADKIPKRDGRGRTVWVTRERPKIDRIACPWLIRRFVDPAAVVLFVASPEVPAVAERFNAA